VNDNWWQTESGWPISSNYLNLTRFETRAGSATKPAAGWDVMIMDDDDNVINNPEKPGKIVIKLPCSPGHMDGLWEND
jgi:propionyl-CoA synthetase